MSTDEDNTVLGISLSDPDIVKATQFVLVSVGITAFLLSVELVAIVERQGLHDLGTFETAWWVFDMLRMLVLVFSGYFGVKRSDRTLLLAFFLTALLSCLECIGEAVYEIVWYDPAGQITLSFCEALYFAVAMYYARFLWVTARERNLGERASSGAGTSGYSVLGIQMLDMQVLKATQLLFTSLAIVASIFGSIVVRGAEGAFNHPHWRLGWLILFGSMTSLIFSGYFGVRRSSAGLLFCFSIISGSLFVLFGVFSSLIAVSCTGQGCLTMVFFGFGITAVLGLATQKASFLSDKVKGGTILTAPIVEPAADGVQATTFGAEPAEAESPVQETMDASAAEREKDKGSEGPGVDP